MNIALDLVAVERLDDGIYTSTMALLRGLQRVPTQHRYLLLTAWPERYAAFAGDARFQIVHAPIPVRQRDAILFEHQLFEPLALRRLRPQVVHSPGLASMLLWRGPCVLSVHDIAFLHVPEQTSRASLYYWKYLALPSARRVTHIVTDSNQARQEIMQELGIPPERIDTVYLSIDDRFQPKIPADMIAQAQARYQITPPYLLFVSTLQARKNVIALIRAFEHLAAALPDLQLVLAGGITSNSEAIVREAKQSPVAERIRLTGRVADEDLPAIYAGARVLALPSKFEGFGLTMIEAMACGTPVVANNASCLPEVAGDAALLVDADDTPAFAAALRRTIEDEALRADLITRGFRRAAQFRPESCAAHMIRIYEQVGGVAATAGGVNEQGSEAGG